VLVVPALRLRRRAVHFITDDASEAVAELILEHFVAAEAVTHGGCEMRGKPLRCRLGMHTWVVRREPDVEPYFECARCSKVQVTALPMIGMGGDMP
jgi:hypothetical protein